MRMTSTTKITRENGCPTLAAPLFLRLGWDTTKLNSAIETKPWI